MLTTALGIFMNSHERSKQPHKNCESLLATALDIYMNSLERPKQPHKNCESLLATALDIYMNGDPDGTRTRDLRRDRAAF